MLSNTKMIEYTYGVWNPPHEIWQIIVNYIGLEQDIQKKLTDIENIIYVLETNMLCKGEFKFMMNFLKKQSQLRSYIYKHYINMFVSNIEDREGMLAARNSYNHMCKLWNIRSFLETNNRLNQENNNLDNIVNNETT